MKIKVSNPKTLLALTAVSALLSCADDGTFSECKRFFHEIQRIDGKLKMKIKVSNPKTLLALTAVSALLSCAGFKVFADTTDYSQIPGMPKIELMTGNDRWGCEVLLCLANPNGPRAVSECRPPIDKLFDCLSWRHPCKFPSCPMAGEGNYAKQLSDGFDPCILQGMEDAPEGWIVEGNINDNNQFKTDRRKNKILRKRNASYNWGGEHWFKATEDSPGHWGGTKACVKGYQGTAYESYTCYDSSGMQATTGAVSIGSKQPKTLPVIGAEQRLALRAIRARPMRATPAMTAREKAAALPLVTDLSVSMNR